MKHLSRFAASCAAPALMLAAVALAAHAQTPAAFAPTRFTVTVEGAPGGPAVFLLPGLASSRAVFDAEATLLAPKYRLYRVQVDGFAGQPAGPNASGPILPGVVDELHAYIAANHLHPVIIGHSMGGLMALMLASQHPGDVRKLLIVDALPFYALALSPAATLDTMRPQAEAMRAMLQNQPPAQQAAQAEQTASYMVNNPDARKQVLAATLASDRAVMIETLYEDLNTDLRPQLPAIETPTLLLYPFDAAAVGPDPSKIDAVYTRAYRTMPNLRLQRIENSRHFIMYDQPAAFDAAVQSFLASS